MSFRLGDPRGAEAPLRARAIAPRAGRARAAAVALLIGLGSALCPRPALAEDDLSQCMESYEAGQRARREGDLVGAAAELLVCGGPACPVRMQSDCQRWLDDVERATPAVVFRVRDARGMWLNGVSASIDGSAPRRLDGRAIAMNPGEHVIVFRRDGYRPLRTPVIVAEGEKLERRVITLHALAPGEAREPAPLPEADAAPSSGWDAAAATPAASPASAEPPVGAEGRNLWGPLALGAVAVVGGVGFVYFGVRAQSGEADLEQCTPNCTQARVDDVKEDFLRSNVSLGVGLVGLVGAGLWLLIDRPAPLDGRARRDGHGVHTAFGLGPSPHWEVRF